MTDTLDFPTIDDTALARLSAAPPAPKTEVASAAAGALDLDKLDLSTLALSKFAPVRKQLADATKTLTGTVHDLSTQAKVDDAKSLRQRLLNAPLADGRKISRGLKSKLKSVSDAVGAELESIEADFAEAAKLITPQIEAREKELQAEKEAREAKEAARRQEFEDKVKGIRNYLALAQGLPSPRIEKGITFLTAMVIGEEWVEFKPIAQKALDETLASLRELLAKTQAAEVEAAERERVRAENERLRAENERIQAELAAQRAEVQRQQDELAARERAAKEAEATARAVAAQHVEALAAVDAKVSGDTPTTAQVVDKMRDDAAIYGTGFARTGIDESGEVKVETVLAREVWVGVDLASEPSQSAELVVGPAIDVAHPDADEEGAPLVSDALLDLLAHIDKAFDTKFPSQPKPPVEWWAKLKRLAAEVSA